MCVVSHVLKYWLNWLRIEKIVHGFNLRGCDENIVIDMSVLLNAVIVTGQGCHQDLCFEPASPMFSENP